MSAVLQTPAIDDAAAELDRHVQLITRLEGIVAGWEEGPALTVRALKSAIEELNKEALRRLVRWLKDDAAAGAKLRAALADPFVYAVLRFHGLVSGEPCAASLRWPHAIATWQGRLCVADAGNNRVMVWGRVPDRDNAPCEHVLGQRQPTSVDNNLALYWPNAASLNMPYGMAAVGEWLVVADTANSRLFGWRADDCRTGAPAHRARWPRSRTSAPRATIAGNRPLATACAGRTAWRLAKGPTAPSSPIPQTTAY